MLLATIATFLAAPILLPQPTLSLPWAEHGRLYYYDREYPVARIAAGLVRESWRYLVDRFQYKPSVKVPYILYNTYREFLETNVFQVQEGVLGVTSPQDLRMSLPYAGEREMFKAVSTHEMTHQFQIQKVAERAAS